MAIYAAYGSNLDPEQMAVRAPFSPLLGTGWLHGWRLTFAMLDGQREGALATVVEQPGARVFVALYDLTEADERSLDAWEDADLRSFAKLRVRVAPLRSLRLGAAAPEAEQPSLLTRAEGEDVLAYLYVGAGFEGGLPSAGYLALLAAAAARAGAPPEYVTDLRRRPTR